MAGWWDSFAQGFCKVQFLCFAGDPNWLGWIVLAFGALLLLGVFILFLATILGD